MGYKQAIEEVLKARLKANGTALAKWKEREQTGSLQWVNEQCGRGQGPFLTEELVLCYCMTYMHSHYEAASKVLVPFADSLDRNSVVAMLDIGCGPMTAALALAELNIEKRRLPLKLKYIGVDTSAPMLDMAEAFSEQEHCFAEPKGRYWRFLPSIKDVTDRRLENLTRGASHVIVILSYLLAQTGLSLQEVEKLAEVLEVVQSVTRRSQKLWIAYTNAAGVYGNKFAYFLNACRDVGVRFDHTALTRRKHDFWQHRLARYDVVKEMTARGDNLEFLVAEFL